MHIAHDSGSTLPLLTPVQARVLGVLVEKEHTVPDTYPMTLNALLAGCNQKTSREPVMNLREADILEAIDSLKSRVLVIESSGGRAMRYEQNARRVIDMPSAALALLTVLILRGPQTAGELRQHSERLHRFADISSVEAFLEEMATRPGGALVVQLPRLAGSREQRWAHLLCGPTAAETAPASSVALRPGVVDDERLDALQRSVDAMRAELAELRARVNALSR